MTNNAEGTDQGSLTPIDPATGKPGTTIPVDDPYNLYFTPDGKSAIVVAEAKLRLDLRDPHSMALQSSIEVPGLRRGEPRRLHHRQPLRDLHLRVQRQPGQGRPAEPVRGRLPQAGEAGCARGASSPRRTASSSAPIISQAFFNCQLAPRAQGVGLLDSNAAGSQSADTTGMPQDIRSSPDGKTFYVADMMVGGVYLIDPASFVVTGFIPTGPGTPRALPEPQRQAALHRQPGLGPRRRQRPGRSPAACRCSTSPRTRCS